MSDPAPCQKCGNVHLDYLGKPGCVAHGRTTGLPCKKLRCPGQKVCFRHGGGAPQSRAKGAYVQEEARARKLLAGRLETAQPIEHPIYELLKLASESTEWKNLLRERLQELESLETTDKYGVEHERALVTLYTRALEQLGKLLSDMAKLDLQTRALRLQKEAAVEVMAAVSKALHKAGLSEHETLVRSLLAEAIKDMRGGQAVEVEALPAPPSPQGDDQ